MTVRGRRVSVPYTYFHYLDVTGWDVWAHPTADAQVADVLVSVNQGAAADRVQTDSCLLCVLSIMLGQKSHESRPLP